MQNIGEEICGEYLKSILKCDFVTYNVSHPDLQGEMDVIGVKLQENKIYLCESATHTGGLQYVRDNHPDDYNKFYFKFKNSVSYAKKYFPNYTNIALMLWSPIVRVATEKAKYNTYAELQRLKANLHAEFGISLDLVINESYRQKLAELSSFAEGQTEALNSPVMRFLQISTKLNNHISKMKKKKQKIV